MYGSIKHINKLELKIWKFNQSKFNHYKQNDNKSPSYISEHIPNKIFWRIFNW